MAVKVSQIRYSSTTFQEPCEMDTTTMKYFQNDHVCYSFFSDYKLRLNHGCENPDLDTGDNQNCSFPPKNLKKIEILVSLSFKKSNNKST